MKHKDGPGRAAVQLRLADTSDIVKARQLGYYQTGVVEAKFYTSLSFPTSLSLDLLITWKG